MATLVGLISLGAAVILQTTVVSRVALLHGPADLVLLVLLGWTLHERVRTTWQWGVIAGFLVGLVSALPLWLPLAGYLSVTATAHLLQRRVWQVPILTLFVTTFLGTFVIQGLSMLYLLIGGTPLDIGEAFNLVILPSVILNLLLALPVYGLFGEVANWLYPSEVEA